MNKDEYLAKLVALTTTFIEGIAPDITPLQRIARLAGSVARAYLSGQDTEGVRKQAQEILDRLGDLPTELR